MMVGGGNAAVIPLYVLVFDLYVIALFYCCVRQAVFCVWSVASVVACPVTLLVAAVIDRECWLLRRREWKE